MLPTYKRHICTYLYTNIGKVELKVPLNTYDFRAKLYKKILKWYAISNFYFIYPGLNAIQVSFVYFVYLCDILIMMKDNLRSRVAN